LVNDLDGASQVGSYLAMIRRMGRRVARFCKGVQTVLAFYRSLDATVMLQ
jgi:hypothetical protein